MISRLSLTASVCLALSLAAPSAAEACRCKARDFTQKFNEAVDVVKGRVTSTKIVGTQRLIRVRIEGVYKGCLETGRMLNILTPRTSAACGLSLSVGKTYLLSGNSYLNGTTQYMYANSCGLQVLFGNLTSTQATFLNGRYNCCGDKCACVSGLSPVNCFANPCMVESCPEGTCESNYCGGCNAEYYTDAGRAVCNPCETDADCGLRMHCNDQKMCRSDCASDEDCDKGQWCRVTSAGDHECVPYALKGENCGGGVAPWYLKRCEPGMNCVNTIPNMLGGPGHCMTACATNDDCELDEYCHQGKGSCYADGDCWAVADCSVDGNAWAHVACTGYAVCAAPHCTWKCGAP